MTKIKIFFTCCYTLPKSDLFAEFFISINYTLCIELLSQNLGNHLDSSPLFLHLPHPITHQILLTPLLKLFSNCPLLSIPIATTLFQSHYNLPPGLSSQHPSPKSTHVTFQNTFHTYRRVKLSFDPFMPQLKNLSLASYYP